MLVIFLAALGAFLADQASKYLVVHMMGLSQIGSMDILPPVLNFRYGENRGINFGLLDSDAELARWLLIGFSIVISVAVVWWLRHRRHGIMMRISAGLLVGGALGNVADRLLYGYVLDFLNMSCCGIANPFVFNLADVFIFAGALGLILFDGGKGRKKAA